MNKRTKRINASKKSREQLIKMIGNGDDITNFDTSQITDMSYLFHNVKNIVGDISVWDTSNVTDMNHMFYGVSAFNQDISGWDTSNVRNMDHMFYGARSFNQDISNWDVSNVTNMSSMFGGASAFNGNIGSWDVSNVTNMEGMFYRASIFNGNIGSWNVSNVIYMSHMFSKAKAFNQPIGNWDVSNVTNMRSMFYRAKTFNQPINKWDVSNVTNMENMFEDSNAFDQDLSNWNIKNKKFKYMFSNSVFTHANSLLKNFNDKHKVISLIFYGDIYYYLDGKNINNIDSILRNRLRIKRAKQKIMETLKQIGVHNTVRDSKALHRTYDVINTVSSIKYTVESVYVISQIEYLYNKGYGKNFKHSRLRDMKNYLKMMRNEIALHDESKHRNR